MSTGRSKSFLDKARSIPSSLQLTDNNEVIAKKSATTTPGVFAEYLGRQSDALQENARLKEESRALKSNLIRLDLLVEVEGRKRKLSPIEFDELRENLRHNDLSTPITVRSLPNGQFELISGHNRVQAFRDLGRTEIFGVIRDFDKLNSEKGAFYSNLIQNTLPDYEKYLGFKRLMAETGMTQSEVAEDSGLAKVVISGLMDFDDLPKEAREMIAASPWSIGRSLIAKIKGLPCVVDAVKAVIDGTATQGEALAIATAKTRPAIVKNEPRLIKFGTKRFAELSSRNGAVIIKFKDPSKADELIDKIEALIRLESKS